MPSTKWKTIFVVVFFLATVLSLFLFFTDPGVRGNIEKENIPSQITIAPGIKILPEFEGQPPTTGIYSKMCTEEDFNSYWFNEKVLHRQIVLFYQFRTPKHRKTWELTYIVYVVKELNLCQEGKRGLVLAVGNEPLVSYFVSTYHCSILATDMPSSSLSQDWSNTNQHSSNLDKLYVESPNFTKEDFLKKVSFKALDMNNLPSAVELGGRFDFIWSTCSIEHVGNITLGQKVVMNSMRLLKPGGVAIHTTEFTVSSLEQTIEKGITVLWRKKDIEKLVTDLRNEGFYVYPVHFGAGTTIVDQTPDLPPYGIHTHLKLLIGQYICTSFAIVVKKPLTMS